MQYKYILIGSTGYVGGHLKATGFFDLCLNSKSPMDSLSCDLLVIAAPGSERWKSETDPISFRDSHLHVALRFGKIKAKKSVLISSIDAYSFSSGYYLDKLDVIPSHPYGKAKFILEKLFNISHPNGSIIRLPNIFGGNLKKNIIYDLLMSRSDIRLNNNTLQWYPLEDLLPDIISCSSNSIPLLFPASQPITNLSIVKTFFPDRENDLVYGDRYYDIKNSTKDLITSESYKYSEDQILQRIKLFIFEFRDKIKNA
jgi:hypothetical protein